MERFTRLEVTARRVLLLRTIAPSVPDPRTRFDVQRLEYELVRELPLWLPKRVVARLLDISPPTVDRWIDRGRLVTKAEGSRERVMTEQVLRLAALVHTDTGPSRGKLERALAKTAWDGTDWKPNETFDELRRYYRETEPIDRLQLTFDLSAFLTGLAALR